MSTSKFMGILFFISMLGTIGSIIFLIYKQIKKQPKKPASIALVSCIIATIVFSALMIFTMTPEEQATMAEKQAQKQAAELAKKEADELARKEENKAKQNIESETTATENSQKSPSPSISAKTICPVAGIGDKLSDFEKAYGVMTDTSGNKTFKSNTITVLPLNELAWNVSVKVNSSSRLQIDAIKDFLPSDMKIIKEYSEDQFNDGNIRYITIGESELLKNSFPKDEGKLIIIQRVYVNKSTKSYNNFIIASGDTP